MTTILRRAIRSATPKSTILAITLIAAATLALYASSLSNGFVYDDNNQILKNPWIKNGTAHIKEIMTQNVAGFDNRSASNYYRPMMHLTYTALYSLFGFTAWPYHLLNILLHCATSCVVFILTRRIINRHWPEKTKTQTAIIAALVFAAHPIHTEAVMWVSALPDMACAFFYLSSLHLYISHYDKKGFNPWRYWLSLALFATALFYKETAITLIPLIIILDTANQKTRYKPLAVRYARYIPYALAGSIYLALRLNALGGMAPTKRLADLTALQKAINAAIFFAEYMGKTILPTGLNAFHVFHPVTSINKTVIASVLLIITYLSALYLTRRNRPIFLSLAIFLLPLLPALYLPALGENPFTERYLYLPSSGFAIAASIALTSPRAKILRHISRALITLILVLYSAAIIQRAPDWADDVALWKSALRHSTNNPTLHAFMGEAFYRAGKLDQAIEHYKKSLSINPTDAIVHLNLGVAYQLRHSNQAAIWEYMNAILLKGNLYEAFANIGTIYIDEGNMEKAAENCTISLRIFPDYASAHECLGIAYANTGRMDDAITEFQAAAKLVPDSVQYRTNVEKAYAIKNAQGEAQFRP